MDRLRLIFTNQFSAAAFFQNRNGRAGPGHTPAMPPQRTGTGALGRFFRRWGCNGRNTTTPDGAGGGNTTRVRRRTAFFCSKLQNLQEIRESERT